MSVDMCKRWSGRGAATLLMACSVSLTPTLLAQGVYNSDGFESPSFVPVILAGQDALDPAGPWIAGVGTATAEVVTVFPGAGSAEFGNQAVEAFGGGTFMGVDETVRNFVVAPFVTAPSGIYEVSSDIFVESTGNDPFTGPYGPFFGLSVFDNDGTDFTRVAFAGIDATDGSVVQGTTLGVLQPRFDLAPIALDTWVTLSMLLDYDSSTYDILVDGIAVVEDLGFMSPGTSADDLDFVGLTVAVDESVGGPFSTTYFDNFFVTPEPGMAILLGCGFLATMGKRRRRA